MNKKKVGNWGEKVAQEELKKKGFEIIDTNFNTRFGEIDIIAKKNNEFIFVEVKTRQNTNYGSASESISSYKIQHLAKAINIYIQEKKIENYSYRVCLASIDKIKKGLWKFKLIADII